MRDKKNFPQTLYVTRLTDDSVGEVMLAAPNSSNVDDGELVATYEYKGVGRKVVTHGIIPILSGKSAKRK